MIYMVTHIVARRFEVGTLIGRGSFGEVVSCFDRKTKQKVAMKIERAIKGFSLLVHEQAVYAALEGVECVPRILWKGRVGTRDAMVMDLLGPSLKDLLQRSGGRFPLKTLLHIADQCLLCIEQVHTRRYIHRDIKPENFLLRFVEGKEKGKEGEGEGEEGEGEEGEGEGEEEGEPGRSGDTKRRSRAGMKLSIVDFGLSKVYLDKDDRHLKNGAERRMVGTDRYASIDALKGNEQSRRSDMESLAYMFLYFLIGKLPWQGIKERDKSIRRHRICELKAKHCQHSYDKNHEQFHAYLRYCRRLRFEETPDYAYCRGLFSALFKQRGFV
jgi:serine/threonine protein kinase